MKKYSRSIATVLLLTIALPIPTQAITLRQLIGRNEKGLLSHEELLHHKDRFEAAVEKKDTATIESVQNVIGEDFIRVVRGSRTMPDPIRKEIASSYQSLALTPHVSTPLTRGIIDILLATTKRARSSTRQAEIADVARRLRKELQVGLKGLPYDVSNTLRNIADLTGRMQQFLPVGLAPNILQRMKRRMPGLKTTALLALMFATYVGGERLVHSFGKGVATPFAERWTPEEAAKAIGKLDQDTLRTLVTTAIVASQNADEIKGKLIADLKAKEKEYRTAGNIKDADRVKESIHALQASPVGKAIAELSPKILKLVAENPSIAKDVVRGAVSGYFEAGKKKKKDKKGWWWQKKAPAAEKPDDPGKAK